MTAVVLWLALSGCARSEHTSWTTENGVQVTETVEGDGAPPKKGDAVFVNYVASFVDGQAFDTQMNRDDPYVFRWGVGDMMAGVEEGMASMRPGGKRILVVPPKLAYGEKGLPGTVPPNAWVRFEVELVKIEAAPPEPQPWNDAGLEMVATESGLQYVDFEVGEGEAPTVGGTVVVHYAGFLDDGTLFDTTYFALQPLEFEYAAKDLIPGWFEGLSTMREGGRRKLIIPPYLAYGEKGFQKKVPPNATLVFDIELLAAYPPEE